MTPEDVIFSLRHLQEAQPRCTAYYRHVVEGGEGRRTRCQVHLRRDRATANCRRSSANSRCCPSTGGKAPTSEGRKRDISATTLETPLGCGPLPHQGVRRRPQRSSCERVKEYWGANLHVSVGHEQFRRAALRIFPRHHRGAGSLQGRSGRLAHRETAPRTGRRPTTSRP